MRNLHEFGMERVRRLQRTEYDRMVSLGFFAGERLELIEGYLVAMSPQGALRAEIVWRLNRLFTTALQDRAVVRIQSPLVVSEGSEPQPDVAVVPSGDYSLGHPCWALLVIEVADASLRRDSIKADLYAAAGIPEYWLVNLEERLIEVHLDLIRCSYSTIVRRGVEAVLSPAAFPDVHVEVRALLPPA